MGGIELKYLVLIIWVALTVTTYLRLDGAIEQDNIVMTDPVSFQATISKLDIDSLRGKRGKSIDTNYIHYEYVADEKKFTGKRSVSKEIFNSLKVGDQLDDMIYYRKDPNLHGEKLEYEISAIPYITEIATIISSLILALIFFILYKIFYKPKKIEI